MKKTRTKKIIALALTAVMSAALLTGCTIFEYDEDADMSQTILEINPIEYTYEIPIKVDYEDPYGNPVYEINNDPSSADFGKTTNTVVSAVLRDHDGYPIHVPATNAAGEMLYVGYEKGSDGLDYTRPIETGVTKDSDNIFVDIDGKNRDGYFVIYTKNDNADDVSRSYTATEYRFDGLIYTDSARYALWTSVKDGTTKAGDVTVNGIPSTTASGAANYDAELPVVEYTMSGIAPDAKHDTWEWEENVHVSVTATASTRYEAFYKETLVSTFNSNGYTLYNSDGYTIDECFDEFIEQLYTQYLTYAEAEMAVSGGYVEWGVPEMNQVNKQIYDQIDTALETLYEEVAEDFGYVYPGIEEGENESGTTYPVPPEGSTSGESMEDYKVWHITQEPDRCIGQSDDPAINSLKRAGMRKFVDVIEEYVDDERAISADERADYESEVAEMRNMITTAEGTDKLYTSLYTYDVIWTMYGESQDYTLKTAGLRSYLVSDIEAKESVAREAFAEELARQKSEYKSNIQSYYSDATDGNTILYYADDEIFWVKHILIPFSDDQTAALDSYKKAGHSDAEVEEYRRELGMAVEVYKHVDGEEDTSRTYTIQQAYNEILSGMSAVAGNAKEAAETFDELIYTYNTDDGIFDNEMGYAVTATPEDEGGLEETYMIEFATESRALYNAYRNNMSLAEYKDSDPNDDYVNDDAFTPESGEVEVGSISIPVLTDYGWHIMYLNVVPKVGQSLAFDDYLTPAEKTTAGAAYVEDVSTNQDNFYNNWSYSMANGYFNQDGIIVVHKDRFESYLDDFEEQYKETAAAEEEEEEGTTDDSHEGHDHA